MIDFQITDYRTAMYFTKPVSVDTLSRDTFLVIYAITGILPGLIIGYTLPTGVSVYLPWAW